MYLAIIILPLLGSIASGFFGRKIGVSGSQLITCTAVVLTTLLAVLAFFEVGLNNIPVSIEVFRWIDSESLNVSWGFYFDSLTVSMLIPVLIVSSLVHIYSIGYMSEDPHIPRFFSYLSLFTFMMVILVTSNNYLLMFVGWEGVGVCSYLLVCFWFTRIAANQSALSAFLTNRVGDCFLTIGMFAILWSVGNLDYATVFSLAPYMNENVVTIVGICLLIGAMAKSSQVGLHVWLPMAMLSIVADGPWIVTALKRVMVRFDHSCILETHPLIYSCTREHEADFEGFTGGFPSKTGSVRSTGSGSVAPLSESATGKSPESSEKFKIFSELREKKYEIIDEIQDNNGILKSILSAEKLDKKLPETAKDKNRHLSEIKEDFPSFFDEDSGTTSIKEGLDDLKDYIYSEQGSLKSKLKEIESKIKDLTVDSTEDKSETNNPTKRDGIESDADTQQSAKKKSRDDDGDDNNGSGPPSSSGPPQGGSDTSPPSSPDLPGGSSDTSSHSSQMQLLDIIITIISVILGDDNLDQ